MSSEFTQRWAWAEIDLTALAQNVREVITDIAPLEMWAVVKANGYGHGALECATTALEAGAQGLCVALAEEGFCLRRAGLGAPILVLSEQPSTHYSNMIKYGLIATLYNYSSVAAYSVAAAQLGIVGLVHLKVDTGMHRVGVTPDNAHTIAQLICDDPWLALDGVFTHLAAADATNHEVNARQISQFDKVCAQLSVDNLLPSRVHIANSSAALQRFSSLTNTNLARIGIAMYGIASDSQTNSFGATTAVQLRPVMSLKARVSHVQWLEAGEAVSYGLRRPLKRRSCVATLPIGYADGVSRGLWSAGQVLIGGQRCAIAGTITMDQLLVNCESMSVQVGDIAVLVGSQGTEHISANEVACHLGSIGYEVVSSVGARVPRIFVR